MYDDIYVNIPWSDEEIKEARMEAWKEYADEKRRVYIEEVKKAMREE